MYVLGIDIGTSGCKAVAFDDDGVPAAESHREYDVVLTPDGGAELDSDEVIGMCFDVIRDVASQLPAGAIEALGVSSQGEAFTAIGPDGTALSRAMVSSDTRSAGLIGPWVESFGAEKLYGITGHTAHPMFSLFKLLWLKEHRPDVWSATRKFLCFEDLLGLRLGTEPAMGWPLAGRTMLFDVSDHVWNGEILEAAGIDQAQLARPLASGSVAGTVDGDMATRLGLNPGTRVVTGGHDQPCGALGAGVVEPGLAMYATGTVECITPAFSEAVFTPALRSANLCTYDHTVSGMYATVAFSLTGGNILKWFRDEFGAVEKAEAERSGEDAYELLLRQMASEPSPLMVLPYFTPTGTPYFDTDVSGAILGLKLSTKRTEVMRALLEGVALEMRLNLSILEQSGCAIRELRLIGGGARSAAWSQLKADVIGKPVTTLNVTEAGCLGVAMLARCAVTGEDVPTLAKRWIRPVSQIAPRPEHAEVYAQRFARYKELYPALRPLLARSRECDAE